jgi:hypothetical protein
MKGVVDWTTDILLLKKFHAVFHYLKMLRTTARMLDRIR